MSFASVSFKAVSFQPISWHGLGASVAAIVFSIECRQIQISLNDASFPGVFASRSSIPIANARPFSSARIGANPQSDAEESASVARAINRAAKAAVLVSNSEQREINKAIRTAQFAQSLVNRQTKSSINSKEEA